MSRMDLEDFCMEHQYTKRCDAFFYYHDRNYCKRNYEAIKKLK